MEWIERAIAESVDPGGSVETEVGRAVREMPDLKGRWSGTALALNRMRRSVATPKPPVPLPPPPLAEVGTIQLVHATFGVFVKLEKNAKVSSQQALEAVRGGKIVATLRVQNVTKPDTTYPSGAAVCTVSKGAPMKGDRVRSTKK